MNYRRIIPNMCTASNLVFGMCSMLSTLHHDFLLASIFIFCALVADGLDGRTARFFGVASEFGKEMDSLCDLGSFGVAPALLAYEFCLKDFGILGCVVAIFFACCGMWRLTRFNVNANDIHGYFQGLAIPAGGNIVAMTTMLFVSLSVDPHSFGWSYPLVMAIVAYLMVSQVHYPNFKGDGGDKMYLVPKIFAALMFVAIVWAGRGAVCPAVFVAVFSTYAAFGIVNSLFLLFCKKD
ncbi:CDP-diacylglycerol--serine O-phosphatidyltransferase [uncultured Selenomonas sp.]|uniref:CDP-diacylglycerol--serine O-phosphatidyltransferase n=1 Tax=uncultured Selenomonas sp. TaxID=159275 RepID=UPI0025E8724C|nr:CDP-diacylglycerol--serine O-phosphatidyltransferase [uncultured Selenomonas sp.]